MADKKISTWFDTTTGDFVLVDDGTILVRVKMEHESIRALDKTKVVEVALAMSDKLQEVLQRPFKEPAPYTKA